MNDEERDFARQAQFLKDAHQLADAAIDLGGDQAAALLLSAALVAIEQTVGMEHGREIARMWAQSIEAVEAAPGEMH